MSFSFKQYIKNTVNYDLLNKFAYKNVSKLPVLSNVDLQFRFKTYNLQSLITSLSALEIISLNKCKIVRTKSSNISLKLRKGSPIGCKVTLRKTKALIFIVGLINTLFIEIKTFRSGIGDTGLYSERVIPNTLIFPGLSGNYHFFRLLDGLHIKLLTTSKTNEELDYLLRSYKLKH